MPLYMSLAGEFGYGRSHSPPFDAIDFGTFSNWHTSNASTIAQTSIPFFYNYVFDGSPSTIEDGGFNMWNVGNAISFSTTSNITYGTISSVFYVSQPNVWPQVALAYTTVAGTLQWGNSGLIGMAGSPFGSNANYSGTYVTSNQGRGGQYWVNQKYGLTNPTICYLWFTIGQSTVNSQLSGYTDSRSTSSPPLYTYTQSVSVSGSKILFGQMLLSSRTSSSFPNGNVISQENVETFLANYVGAADIRML
jgi:hypothetical protein